MDFSLTFYLKNNKFKKFNRAYACYTLDVITSCCFGYDMCSIKDSENEMYKQIQKIVSLELSFSPKILLACKFSLLKH
jgi:hypothetical protein